MAHCDVAVVGAGIIGQAVAHELAVRGTRVLVLESRSPGLGATQAAAGMLVPFLEGFGRPILPMAAKSLEMYDQFIARVTEDSGQLVTYDRSGSLQVVGRGESNGEIEDLASAAQKAGVACELFDMTRTSREEPALAHDIEASLLIPTHGFVVAQELSLALRLAAERRGAQFRTGASVRRIRHGGGSIEVEVGNGDTVTAGRVVLAAGSWSGQIEIDGVPRLPVKPVRGQLLHLEAHARILSRIVWGSRCYLVPVGPSSILVGATVEDAGFDERVTAAGVRDLLDAACDLVPSLWQSTFAGARVGLRPATADELPIVGRSRRVPGLVYATGHYRNGILLAPLTARAVADLVCDRGEEPLLGPAAPHRLGEY